MEIKTESTEIEKKSYKIWEGMLEAVQQNFLNDGELSPVVFIGLKDGDGITMGIMPVGDFMQSVKGKDTLADLMKQIGKKEPVFLSLVTEAWMSEASTKGSSKEQVLERYKEMPPSQDPDRKEVILCTFESENLVKQKMFKIGRDPLSLEEWRQPEGVEYSGRFVGILKDMKKIKYN